MGTQGTGRKRNPNKERSTVEEDALNLIAREAEARLAAKRAARAEAREIRMKELERQQKEISDEEERASVGIRGSVRAEDREYIEKGSRTPSILSSTTLTSLGGTSSRRGSGETSITADSETSIREIKEIHELKDQIQDVETKYMQNLKEVKDALVVVEEKYRKAMVSNAQLDNEKNNLMYYVDTLKDSLMELEELLSESHREYEEKAKECEREKHNHGVLQFQFNELKETIKQSEELLTEIRQLRLKQDGFVREVADLQETVEWKDKKIAALERQKEYSDAIRTERDELRDEVVQLKDILKKHGIVLGPDLSVNGGTVEPGSDSAVSGDSFSHPALNSQMLQTEGNSILGRAEEMQLDSRGRMDQDPEKQQDICDGNCPISPDICTFPNDFVKQPCREEHESFSGIKSEIKSSTSLSEVNSEVSCFREHPDEVVTFDGCSKQSIAANAERKSAGDLKGTSDIDVRENYLEIQVLLCGEDNEDPQERLEQPCEEENEELCQASVPCYDPSLPSDEVVLKTIKTCAHGNSIHSHIKIVTAKSDEIQELTETQKQDMVNNEQQITSSSRKKKKKKKSKKKKGVTQEDEIQEEDMQEINTTERIQVDKVELADLYSSATEPLVTLKESHAQQDNDEEVSEKKHVVQETHEDDPRYSVSFPNAASDVSVSDSSNHIKIQTISRGTSIESTSKTHCPKSERIDCSNKETTNVHEIDSDINTNISQSDKNNQGNKLQYFGINDGPFDLTTICSDKDPVLEVSTGTQFISADPVCSEEPEIPLTFSRDREMVLDVLNKAAKSEIQSDVLTASVRNETDCMCNSTSVEPYCNTSQEFSCVPESQLHTEFPIYTMQPLSENHIASGESEAGVCSKMEASDTGCQSHVVVKEETLNSDISYIKQGHIDIGPVLANDPEDETNHDSLWNKGYLSQSLEERQKDLTVDKMKDEETSQEPIEKKGQKENIEGKLFDSNYMDLNYVGSAVYPVVIVVPEEPDGAKFEQTNDETKVLEMNLPIVKQEQKDERKEIEIPSDNSSSASEDHLSPQNKGKDVEQQLNIDSEQNDTIGDRRYVLGKLKRLSAEPEKTTETKEQGRGLTGASPVEEGVEAIHFGLQGTQSDSPINDEQVASKNHPSRRGSKNSGKKGKGKEDCKMS